MTNKARKSEFPPPVNKRKAVMFSAGLVAVAAVLVVLQLAGLKIPFVTPQTQNHNLAVYQATVNLDAQGFEPATMTVKPATRIFFNNVDTKNHKVDPGATPDATFGSPSEIMPETGYVFVFQKKGVYQFHDADNPVANAEVVVQ